MRRLAAPLARLAAAAGAGAALACASMQAPPGGPEDHEPPQLIRVSPESGTVNFRGRVVEFRFDEVVNDRGTGAAALGALVLISPRDGTPRVSWRREALAVRPRGGWRPNTAYAVTLLPGLADLRNNTMRQGRTVVLSTGPTMPALALRGRAFDWMAERPAPRAWVEAIARPDSVVYVTIADSSGIFTIAPLPAGTYTVRAWLDQNANRALDRPEAWDSVTTQPPAPGVVTMLELRLAPRDTAPPRIVGAAAVDSVTLTVDFDRPLEPTQSFTPALFAVVRADSTPVPVREALPRRLFDAAEEMRRAARDSARPDTVRRDTTARRDTAARRDTIRQDTLRPPVRPGAARPRLVRAGQDAQPKPSAPPPPTQVVLRLGAPVVPGTTYRVTVTGVRNLLGRSGTSTRVLQIPRPAPADTTRPRPAPP